MTEDKAKKVSAILSMFDDLEVRIEKCTFDETDYKVIVLANQSAIDVVNAITSHERLKCSTDKRVLLSIYEPKI